MSIWEKLGFGGYRGFSREAEQLLQQAVELAGSFGCSQADTGHLLLAMLQQEQGAAARFLNSRHISEQVVRRQLAENRRGPAQHLDRHAMAPDLRRTMDYALIGAQNAHVSRAEPEHLLCAMLEDDGCTAGLLLASMGVPLTEAVRECRQLSGQFVFPAQPRVSASMPRAGRASDKYCRDLTRRALDGELDPVFCREAELDRMVEILCRRQKNDPCLIGEPGVGKSTMLLQLCGAISNQHSVLYITGEESVRQVKLRAARLKVPQDNIFLAAENDVDEICGLIEKEKPDLVVIDSIQTMRCMDISSSSGTVSQVKESAARLLAVAKKQEIPMFIVGHVNKDGAIAGPKVMEHIVDTVLYFEGDKMLPYRILRAAKNRYGSTNELGMFDMTGTGLAEIENPSQMLLEGRPLGVSGNCVACTMEGSRPILSEIQALATKTNFPAPRRACSGYDYNRMNLLIAVLEKRAGYFFGNLDVYVNIVGGIALRDTACDLSVCLSMVSSLLDRPVSDKLIAIGEVGLGGEVRSVPNLEQRLHEAERIGFERAVVPKHSLNHLNPADYPGMKLIGAAYISDAINALKTDRL